MLTRRAFALSLTALVLSGAPALAQYDSTAYDNAESAVMSAGKSAKQVAGLRSVAGISAYNMRFSNSMSVPFEFDRSPQAFGITVEKHQGEVKRLQAALRRNPATARALAAHNISPSRVAGVHISSNGWLTLYLQ